MTTELSSGATRGLPLGYLKSSVSRGIPNTLLAQAEVPPVMVPNTAAITSDIAIIGAVPFPHSPSDVPDFICVPCSVCLRCGVPCSPALLLLLFARSFSRPTHNLIWTIQCSMSLRSAQLFSLLFSPRLVLLLELPARGRRAVPRRCRARCRC